MPTFLRLLLVASLLLAPARAANNNAAPPPVPAPAYIDVVSFDFDADGETHKVVVTMSPNLTRVDEASEGYSVIYYPNSQFYTASITGIIPTGISPGRRYAWRSRARSATRCACRNSATRA